jgi:cupin fold WbuC family metalloprotein
MKLLNIAGLDDLSGLAMRSPRLRAHYNFHEELADPVQRLAVAMEPDTLVLPHRHPHTWEMLFPLRGRFVVLHFDEIGAVVERRVLGVDAEIIENPQGVWHSVLSLDVGGVIFEIKQGPYRPLGSVDVCEWAGGASAGELNAWYSGARIGDRFQG